MNIGITGSIACGKSTVTNYLKNLGYKVIDADKIGHEILFNEDVKEKIVSVFGFDIIDNNEINRTKLGNIVFSNKESLKKLNAITHPEIKKVIFDKQEQYKDEQFVFLDIALLFESTFKNTVEKSITVYINEQLQLERLMKRNSLSKEDALKRINSQMSTEEKKLLADYVIDNSGTLEETYRQVDELLKKLEKKNCKEG